MLNVDQLTIEVVDCGSAGSGGRIRPAPNAEYRISKLQGQSCANADDRGDKRCFEAIEQGRNAGVNLLRVEFVKSFGNPEKGEEDARGRKYGRSFVNRILVILEYVCEQCAYNEHGDCPLSNRWQRKEQLPDAISRRDEIFHGLCSYLGSPRSQA